MKIFVNGEARELAASTSVAALLSMMDLVGKRIAVEVNRDIIPRAQHDTTLLNNGDRIEIVHAIGGG